MHSQRRLIRRLRIALLIVAGLAAIAAGGWFWVVPALARDQARLILADFWTGPIEIEGLDLDLHGLTTVRRIRLCDEDGREWARFEGVTFRPKSWPSLEAVAAELNVRSALFRVHVTRGRIVAPLRRPTQPMPEQMSFQQMRFALATDTGLAHEWGPLQVQLSRRDNTYRLGATGLPPLVTVRRGGDYVSVNGRADVSEEAIDIHLTGGAARGAYTARASAGFDRAGKFNYNATLDADFLDVDLVVKDLLGRPGRPGGRLTFKAALHGEGTDIAGMECTRGALRIRNVDFARLPVATELLCIMGLPLDNGLTRGDFDCRFTAAGSMLYLQKAEATTALSAVMVEPVGTVDLLTREVNLYLIGTPLRQLRGALGLLGSPLVRLKDTLTRVHVKGRWDQPPDDLVRREPIENLSSGALGFFQALAGTADTLRGNGLSSVRDAFRSAFEDAPPTSRPATSSAPNGN